MWGHLEVSPHVLACIINMPKQKRSKDSRWDMEPQNNNKKTRFVLHHLLPQTGYLPPRSTTLDTAGFSLSK